MVEASIGSLRFVPDDPNPISENEIIDEETQERRHDSDSESGYIDTDGRQMNCNKSNR